MFKFIWYQCFTLKKLTQKFQKPFLKINFICLKIVLTYFIFGSNIQNNCNADFSLFFYFSAFRYFLL